MSTNPEPRRGLALLKARALDHISDAVILTDDRQRILYVNPAFERMCGYTQAEIQGRTPRVLQGADTSEQTRRHLREAIERCEPVQAEVVNYRRDGSAYWVDLHIAPLLDDGGACSHFVAISRDITARKIADEALARSEAQHRLIADHATDLISRHDLEGVYLWVSPSVQSMLGYEPDALVGSHPHAVLHPGDAEDFSMACASLVEAGATQTVGYRIRHRDGHYLWFETTCRAVADAAGRPLEILAISRDVTARREAERARHEREKRWRRLVDRTPLPIIVQRDGMIVYANETASRLVGVASPDLFIGQPLAPFLYPDDLKRMQQRIAALMRGDEVAPAETYRVRTLDGDVRQVEAHSVVIQLPDGPALQVVLRDVTLAEQERRVLMQAKAQAESQAERRALTLASLGHEIRSPLTSMLGFAAELADEGRDGPQREMAELIVASGKRLLAIMNSVVELEMPGHEGGRQDLPPTDVNEHVRGVGALMRIQARSQGLTLRVVTPDAPVMASIDGVLFERALLNLVSNAIKYTPRGSVTVTVAADDTSVVVSVADTGIGISEDFRPHLFAEFERAPEAAEHADGVGLGLAITRRLVESMQGRLTVESEQNEGSVFTMRFPGS